jgi:hypothetical protein
MTCDLLSRLARLSVGLQACATVVRPRLAVLLPVGLLALATALCSSARAELKTYYVGVDGAPTVATWSVYAGLVSPNANRLTFLYAHAEDDPTANHFHTIGFWSYTGAVDAPTVVNYTVYTFVTGDPPEVVQLVGNTIPEQFSDLGLPPEPPLSLRPGSGLYAGRLTTGARPEETYSDLEIRSVHALVPFAPGTPEHALLHNTESFGEDWDNSLASAVVALELVSKSAALHIGSPTELSILAHPGDRYVLGGGDTLAFTPVLWVDADTPAGVYTATFKLVDVRMVGWPFGESGEFTISTAVPEQEARR